MILLFVSVFIGAFLLNLYITIFGKSDLEALKNKVSIGKYLKEINKAMDEGLGSTISTILKIVLAMLCFVFLVFNVVLFIIAILAVAGGTYAAKQAHRVPMVNNILNKIATYINRLRP